MMELFMHYANQTQIRHAGIYRYRFQTTTVSCSEIYKTLIITLISAQEKQKFFSTDRRCVEAVFLVQTTNYVYYCNIFLNFINQSMSEQILLFENFLKSNKIKFEIYLENQLNTKTYHESYSIDHILYLRKMYSEATEPLYSYWKWISDILASEINKYILMQLPPNLEEHAEKNLQFQSSEIIKFTNLPNFYHLYFSDCHDSVHENDLIKILESGKKLKMEKEIKQYKLSVKPIKYELFEKYWNYKPHLESYFSIDFVGIIDASLRYNLKILNTTIDLECATAQAMYTLFDVQLPKLTESVIMFKQENQKKYTILFMVQNKYNYNQLQILLNTFDISAKITNLQNYNSYITRDYDGYGYKTKLNSLIFGLYTENAQYSTVFIEAVNTHFYDYDGICVQLINYKSKKSLWFKSIEDCEFVKKFYWFESNTFIKYSDI